MSAYIVEPDAVKVVAYYAWKASGHNGSPNKREIEEIANELMAENVRSVDYRYSESNPVPVIKIDYRVIDAAMKVSPAKAYGAAKCLVYQSCEHPDYYNSRAWSLVCAAKDAAARKMAEALGEDMGWGDVELAA